MTGAAVGDQGGGDGGERNPYRGRPAAGTVPPLETVAPRPSRIELALGSWLGLGALGPFLIVTQILRVGGLWGGPLTESEGRETLGWLIAGAVCGVLAVIGGAAAVALDRRVATRIVGALAIASGVLTIGFFGVFLVSAARTADPPSASSGAASEPTCGPDSHPAFYGGDSRWEPCPQDVADAERFAAELLPALPTSGVTVLAVDSVATDPALLDGRSAETYFGSGVNPDGTLTAEWTGAPVTCIDLTWNGAAWTSQAQGALIEGGCGYADAG